MFRPGPWWGAIWRSRLFRGAKIAPAVAALTVAGLAAPPAPARAAEPTPIGLAYKFYVGGVLIGKAVISGTLTEDGYEIISDVSTSGAASWFVEARMQTRSVGAILDAAAGPQLRPAEFALDTLSGEKAQDVVIRYEGDAPAEVLAEPPFQPRPYQLDPTQQTGAVDPLSAAVLGAVLAGAAGSSDAVCDQRLPIFDGRRRYDLVLEGLVQEETDGAARLVDCRARWTRVGGFKEKFMRKPDYAFTVRLRIAPDSLVVPVRAWGSTEFGGAIAVLR